MLRLHTALAYVIIDGGFRFRNLFSCAKHCAIYQWLVSINCSAWRTTRSRNVNPQARQTNESHWNLPGRQNNDVLFFFSKRLLIHRFFSSEKCRFCSKFSCSMEQVNCTLWPIFGTFVDKFDFASFLASWIAFRSMQKSYQISILRSSEKIGADERINPVSTIGSKRNAATSGKDAPFIWQIIGFGQYTFGIGIYPLASQQCSACSSAGRVVWKLTLSLSPPKKTSQENN